MELQFTFLFYLSPMPCPWEQVTRLYGTDGGFWRKPLQTYRRLLISAITTTWMAVLFLPLYFDKHIFFNYWPVCCLCAVNLFVGFWLCTTADIFLDGPVYCVLRAWFFFLFAVFLLICHFWCSDGTFAQQ